VPDVLIRDLTEDVIRGLDVRASHAGLSRTEYLRRMLTREASIGNGVVTVDDLSRFAESCADLADPEVMKQAWQ
jgi:hypothetical protein